MDINFNVTNDFRCDLITVGTSVVPMPAQTIKVTRGLQLKADSANTGSIYIGKSDVATSGKGFPLKANEGLLLPVDNIKQVSFVSDQAGQKLWYLLL
jgi:hypothetical protein